ncbi:MAG: zf-HC2 domain-containing protein [Bacteroidales bacterium]|nr:zf-HC2 domain-containing protein [Bacteroidales bacterium]
MDCNKIDRDELIDRFIRNELSDQEAVIFEEHLLSCAVCRNELMEREEIINAIQKYSAGETFRTGGHKGDLLKKHFFIFWYVAAAAGVALVVGLFLLPNRDTPSRSSQIALEEIQTDTLKAPQPAEDDVPGLTEKSEEEVIIIPKKEITYLAEYQAYPFYENQIGINIRSGNLTVESPADSVECISGSSVEVRFRGVENDSLFLAILNNSGVVLREDKIASPYIICMQFPKGLYYWQLTDDEETLHTGKIYIR